MIKGFYIGADNVAHKITKITDPANVPANTKLVNNFDETFTYKERVISPVIMDGIATTVYKHVITRDRDNQTYFVPTAHLSSWFWILED